MTDRATPDRAAAPAPLARTRCVACGDWGEAGEYHPYAYCVLVQTIGADAARANLDEVLAHGRKLAALDGREAWNEGAEAMRKMVMDKLPIGPLSHDELNMLWQEIAAMEVKPCGS